MGVVEHRVLYLMAITMIREFPSGLVAHAVSLPLNSVSVVPGQNSRRALAKWTNQTQNENTICRQERISAFNSDRIYIRTALLGYLPRSVVLLSFPSLSACPRRHGPQLQFLNRLYTRWCGRQQHRDHCIMINSPAMRSCPGNGDWLVKR